jgi:hypothetical protein
LKKLKKTQAVYIGIATWRLAPTVPRLAQQVEASHDFTNRARTWRELCCACRRVQHLFSELRF